MQPNDHLYDICGGSFSHSAIRKGLAYSRQNRVQTTSIEGDADGFTIKARVQGSQRRPYVVEADVDVSADGACTINASCTCPVGYNCKHAVAAIAANDDGLPWPDHSPGQSTAETDDRESFATPAETGLNGMFRYWASRLLDTGESPFVGRREQAQTERTLLYVLSADSFSKRARVDLVRASRLKSGRWGKGITISTLEAPSRWNPPPPAGDLPMLRQLLAEARGRAPFEISGAFGAEMLRQIVATGRCYWEDAGHVRSLQPLSPGAARSASLAWIRDADARQIAAVTVSPPAIVLPLDPPFYVDLELFQCGPLAIDVPAAVVARWLEAPAVMPEEAAEAAAAMKPTGLPTPASFKVVARRNVKPVPVLTLRQVTVPPPSWYNEPGEPTTVDVARLSFDYAGVRVFPDLNAEFVRKVSDGLVERIARSHRLERQSARMLEELGFSPLSRRFFHELGDHEHDLELSGPAEWIRFAGEVIPALRDKGWIVEIEPSFSFRLAQVDDWYAQTEPAGTDWFGMELGIVVDGQRVNLIPLLKDLFAALEALRRKGTPPDVVDMRLPDGRIARLPGERLLAIGQILAELHDPAAVAGDRMQLGRLRAAELIDIVGADKWKGAAELRELARRLKAFENIAPVNPPDGLNARLRPYQRDGLSWLQFLRGFGFGGILADDMGLGKTVQALAHLLLEKQAGRAKNPSLVVAPTSLMANWQSEAANFAPGLKVLVSHGTGRKENLDRLAEYDLVVTSYALLPRDEESLKKQPFHLVILDEAQYVKNPHTRWADVARSIVAEHRLCMTGTPMENHLGELWSLMTFLAPGYLGTQRQFARAYRTPIEKWGDEERRMALSRRLRPFILRRKKEEVARELPPKTEIVRTVELAGGQRDLYETIRIAMHQRVKAEVEKRGLARSHIIILDALLKLRQVCCDPRLVKLDRAKKVRESAKLEFLSESLPEMLSEGRRVLLFSQFTSMLDLIEPLLAKEKIPFVRLTGETADRATPVQRFQRGEVPLFLISLKAGGTGLNLTAADTVIHYDPWWNPAVEEQATDRAHRIGQDKPVFVYKLITQGTVEEKILELQRKKRNLIAGILEKGAQARLELTADDLNHLFDPLA